MATINQYEIGDRMRMKAFFDDGATPAVPTDPTTVRLTCYNGDGTITTYTYGVGIVIVKDVVGAYRADWIHTATGEFSYRWVASGVIDRSVTNKALVVGG